MVVNLHADCVPENPSTWAPDDTRPIAALILDSDVAK